MPVNLFKLAIRADDGVVGTAIGRFLMPQFTDQYKLRSMLKV